MNIENKLQEAGLHLPAAIKLPPGVALSFPWVRVVGDRAILSGHGPLRRDGSLLEPLGKVGAEVTEREAYAAARATALAMLASLKSELGDLDRIVSWTRIFGMVNTAPDFDRYPGVIDGCTHLLVDLFGEERGSHARCAIGVAGLPFGLPVEIEGEVLVR